MGLSGDSRAGSLELELGVVCRCATSASRRWRQLRQKFTVGCAVHLRPRLKTKLHETLLTTANGNSRDLSKQSAVKEKSLCGAQGLCSEDAMGGGVWEGLEWQEQASAVTSSVNDCGKLAGLEMCWLGLASRAAVRTRYSTS